MIHIVIHIASKSNKSIGFSNFLLDVYKRQVRYGHRAKEYSNVKELITNSRTEGFGQEVKRRIILETYVLSSESYDAYYKKAQQVRTLVMNEFKKVLDKYDVILTPTSPTVAFDIGSKINDPLAMYLADICTVSVNIAGLPGISIPCGVDKEGMPVGMQLIGNRFAEETLLNAAYTFEQKIKFREQYKPESVSYTHLMCLLITLIALFLDIFKNSFIYFSQS